MVLKKVVGDKIIMYGETEGEDACHNCVDLNKDITGRIEKGPEVPIDYKHYSINNDEIGRKIVEEKKLEEIPYVEHCKIAEDKTEKCETVIGYNPKKFADIGKAREEEF